MLGYALDIAGALDRDRSRPLEQRHRRDRKIAQTNDLLPLPENRSGRLDVLWRWWRVVQANPEFDQSTDFEPASGTVSGRALDRARQAGTYLLLLIGVVLGALVTAAALRYDGSAPVNLISVLAVLVVVPGVMLLLTLMLLPGRVRGFGWLQDVLVTFSPGQWLSAWINRRYDNADLGWFGGFGGSAVQDIGLSADYRRVGKWQLVVYSQALAVGFFLASLATLLLLVTFSDLAFGWSTTLDVPAAHIAQWVERSARPWSALVPGAAPDAMLVAQSQFYRAADLRPEQVRGLGDWWPYLLLAIVCYGLLPRVLLLVFGAWRLRRAQQQLLLGNPQVEKLFERLATPIVLHQVDVAEADMQSVPLASAAAPLQTARLLLPDGTVALVNWNDTIAADALTPWLQQYAGSIPDQILHLGARTEPAAEQQALAALRVDAIVVLAKAWEPPLLEFMDFAQRLKQALGPDGAVAIVPVGIAGAIPAAADFAVWQQMIGELDDVRIGVGALQ